MRRPVYDSVLVPSGFDQAVARLGDHPSSWLPPPAEADTDGFVVAMRASGLLDVTGVEALVEVGPVQSDPPGLAMRPIAWRARHADWFFPRLVADLELSASTVTVCRLALVGSYQPPISVIGDAADRVAGRHVADAVIRTFLEHVAQRVAEAHRAVGVRPTLP